LGLFTRLAFKLFGDLGATLVPRFADLRSDLRKAGKRISLQEYLSTALFTCFVVFLIEIPTFSFILGVVFQRFLFALLTALSISAFLSALLFIGFLRWPSLIVREQAKQIDRHLPFASLYLATIAGSKLPLTQVFRIFSQFRLYPAIDKEVKKIVQDVEMFGYDIDRALERAVARTPSRKFGELIWGILSTRTAGGDISVYLREKSLGFFTEYRRELYEFSRKLTIYIQMYLTAAVLGVLFFVILTSIVSGITGVAANVLFVQFFLIGVFLPLVAVVFIWLVKATSPAGE